MMQSPHPLVYYMSLLICVVVISILSIIRYDRFLLRMPTSYASSGYEDESNHRRSVVETTQDDADSEQDGQSKKNVLFIISDDMRAQISPYQDDSDQFPRPKLSTPNFQRLASTSLVMKNFFVQYSLCGPSRTSMLTSRRPDTTKVYDNDHNWRETGGNFTTLPQYFKEHGYHTAMNGKLFHSRSSPDQDRASWTEPSSAIPRTDRQHMRRFEGKGAGWLQVTTEQEAELPLFDTLLTREIQRRLAEFARNDSLKPFFLGVGFKKPHFSHVCPKEYYDKHPLEQERQFLADISWQEPSVNSGCGIFNATQDEDSRTAFLPHETLRRIRQGYFACISYIDSLLGEILDTLDTLGLANSTVVSFVTDHGFHLGENKRLGKQTVFDAATRVPMLLRVPGKTDGGLVSTAITEAVDLLPTIAEVAGLEPVPPCPKDSSTIRVCTQGKSFAGVLHDVEYSTKDSALSQVKISGQRMKYSIRTSRYRYSSLAYETANGTYEVYSKGSPDHSEELYDHKQDKEEMFDRVDDPTYSEVRSRLREQLQQKMLFWGTK